MWDVQQLFRRYNGDLKRYLRHHGASAETAATPLRKHSSVF
ncbi:hypothetical protein CSIRO_1885 [Bradyrhizobiaceae bacterium SG-6C]|nr:hypothetical protein CSIRO_1885 [Bradyrhizobiaceae bacterium SG-6C]